MSNTIMRPTIEVERFFIGERTADEAMIDALLLFEVRTFEQAKQPEYTILEREVKYHARQKIKPC